MKAIVYTSNTGTTKKYAEIIEKKTIIPAYTLDEAEKVLSAGDEVIYLGWLMAGTIKGYKKAKSKYDIKVVCAVGMGGTGTQTAEVRSKNNIPHDTTLFTLQGGFDINKLSGVYKLMMSVMVKTAGKGLSDKKNRTEDEDRMLDMMLNGRSYVSEENLADFFRWFKEKK